MLGKNNANQEINQQTFLMNQEEYIRIMVGHLGKTFQGIKKILRIEIKYIDPLKIQENT